MPDPSPTSTTTITTTASSDDIKPKPLTTTRPRKSRKLTTTSTTTTPIPTTPSPPPPPPLRVLPRPLTAPNEITSAILHLRSSDPLLTPLISSHDPPSFPHILPPFYSLVRSILYQQLAPKAAYSIFERFLNLFTPDNPLSPHSLLSLSPSLLRHAGVSPRKTSYLLDLAHKYQSGILSDESILSMDDKSLFSMLTMVKGIGAWSVHMFMIYSLCRPDVLPVGDLGVRKGVQMLYGLDDIPRPSQMEQLCERWRPYRTVGCWYMWKLVESKNGLGSSTGGGGFLEGLQRQLEQGQQIVDPIQMLPDL